MPTAQERPSPLVLHRDIPVAVDDDEAHLEIKKLNATAGPI